MIDLAEFLLACYAETEAEARQDDSVHLAPSWTAYILDDLAAKRRIVEDYQRTQTSEYVGEAGYQVAGGAVHAYRAVLRALALPYADHPDYRQEWRP